MALTAMKQQSKFPPVVCVVDFNHHRGPEIEHWIGIHNASDPTSQDWSLLPFLALSDGAHTATEDFSYFTLRHEASGPARPATSLFGISCTRQIRTADLLVRPPDVTRSSVQKAVVVIADTPRRFGHVRESLSIVTKAWFAQRDFSDLEILERFQESLARTLEGEDEERDSYFGMSLRELVHEFKYQTLVLFKCCLLQPKLLFFGSQCERLCMMQFSLLSLIPGLIRNLQDCADPVLNSYEDSLVMPTSLRTSERASLLSYMGLPLQIFGKGSMFGPYTPLQQLDTLADYGTKSYVVGSTNALLLQQKDKYCDVLVNLDERSINIFSPSLRSALSLTTPDRRWVDFLTQAVNDTWDEANPKRPKTMGYVGSEEFIRLQFEEYLLALLSSVKYRLYVQQHKDDTKALLSEVDGDPANEFGSEWLEAWMKTENFRIWNKSTDLHLFDIVEPRHPCAGGLSIEDIQRRLAQQVSELHLDERFQSGREVIGSHLATGQKRVSSAFNKLWADIEAVREAQRKRQDVSVAAAAEQSPQEQVGERSSFASRLPKGPDLSQAQASVQAASTRASAYLSSWGSWAAEKRKSGWKREGVGTTEPPVSLPARPALGTVSEVGREAETAGSEMDDLKSAPE